MWPVHSSTLLSFFHSFIHSQKYNSTLSPTRCGKFLVPAIPFCGPIMSATATPNLDLDSDVTASDVSNEWYLWPNLTNRR